MWCEPWWELPDNVINGAVAWRLEVVLTGKLIDLSVDDGHGVRALESETFDQLV